MAFNIKNDTTDELLRELTDLTGESLTTAVTEALRERLERERRIRNSPHAVSDPIDDAIARFRSIATRPAPDAGDPDEALGYDEHGLPT